MMAHPLLLIHFHLHTCHKELTLWCPLPLGHLHQVDHIHPGNQQLQQHLLERISDLFKSLFLHHHHLYHLRLHPHLLQFGLEANNLWNELVRGVNKVRKAMTGWDVSLVSCALASHFFHSCRAAGGELHDLLVSWYWAGYHAGVFAAGQKSGK